MKSPPNLSRLNFISFNLNVYFFINEQSRLRVLLLPAYSFLLNFLTFTNLGSTLSFAKQKPKPYLLNNWFLYEQSLKRISPFEYYLS